MTADDLVKVIGAIAAFLGAPGLVAYLKFRPSAATNITKMFREERDRLQVRLDAIEDRHAKELSEVRERAASELAAAKATWQAQHETDQAQIAQLQNQVDTLYRRLYNVAPPP